ncbi:MAG: VOC family protein [Pseudomonadales bacterium]
MEICSLGYVIVEASEPAKWLEYGTEVLGMMQATTIEQGDTVYLRMDARPFRIAVEKSKHDRYRLAGWELDSEAGFKEAQKILKKANVDFARGSAKEAQARCVREFIRLDDPSGNTLELYWGASLDYAKFVSPVGISNFQTGFNGDMGFGHAVIPAPKLQETHKFYRDVLGFGDTDYMHFKFSDDPKDPGQGLHFMHCNNPRHHSLALFEDGNNPVGCVHLMLEVANVDEVGYCLDRVNEREIPIVSTLGRHTNDRMLSFYMATPTGFAMEFGCDGLQMDWEGYTPTVSTLPSIWGHKFVQ